MLLETRDLSVSYFSRGKAVPALRGVSLAMEPGESLGLVGESGSGKSTFALALMRLIAPYEGRITRGEILFDGQDVLRLPEEDVRALRGRDIAMIFQDPFTSLDPVLTVGSQVEEAIRVHATDPLSAGSLKEKTLGLLAQVRLPDPGRIYGSYPHQVSGGQRQRAMIAIAIANRPKLLIADEPTTALDVTVQKEILSLLVQLKKELGMALILITHHFGIVANYTDRLAVLYAGEIAEKGATRDVLKDPQHPYTRALLRSLPERSGANFRKKGGRLWMIEGTPPDPANLPSGCIFHPRCPDKVDRCSNEVPELREIPAHRREAACHLAPFEKKT